MNPDLGITRERQRDGFTILEIDTGKATYQGIPYQSLGAYGKRKFENYIVISRSSERLKFCFK